MTYEKPDFSEQIAAGMAWLDEHRPGWVESVDLVTLDLRQACNCVLGQSGGFCADDAEDARERWYGLDVDNESWVFAHGFDTYPNYDALTDQWRAAILARRAGVPDAG